MYPSDNTSSIKVVIGFDFGMKHIGVAVGQAITKSATALPSLSAKQGQPNWQQVQKLIKDWKPDHLVVGVPVDMNGKEQFTTLAARQFALQLQTQFNLPVSEVDERLTSKSARETIFESQGYRGLTKQAIDGLSAKIIVESWLNQ